MSPERTADAKVRNALDALITIVSDIKHFLDHPPSIKEELVGRKRAVAIAKFLKEVEEMRLQFVEVHTISTGARVDVLQSQFTALHVSQRPADLPLSNIPPKPNVFYGRDELVTSIVELLLQDKACRIPILGAGGMGKTSVATTAIHDPRVKEKYGQRNIFVSCEGVVSAEGIVNALATALGLGANGNPRSAVLRYLSSGASTLLTLDNLETALDSADGENVELLVATIAQYARLCLIITMRGTIAPTAVDWEPTCSVPLDRLPLDAARKIWLRTCGHNDDKLDTLLRKLDGLPLAIHLMACQGKYLTPTQLLAAYKRERTRLIKVGRAGRLKSLEVSTRLSLACDPMRQEPNALALLSVLCLLPDGLTIDELPDVLPSMRAGITAAASVLMQVALAFQDKDRLRMLSPIRDFILREHPPHGAALKELRYHFMDLTFKVYGNGMDLTKDRVQVFSANFGNISSVLLQFWRTSPNKEQIDTLLLATLAPAHTSRMSSYGDFVPLLSEAKLVLGRLGNRAGAALCSEELGDLMSNQHRYLEAAQALEDAKASFDDLGFRHGAAECMRSLGSMLWMQGRNAEAARLVNEAKSVFQEIGDRLGAAKCTQVGEVLRLQGKYEEAARVVMEAKTADCLLCEQQLYFLF
ncbi:hypothetical protein CALVIDRAFT_601938 [Calocera viscosa TUFC12733]|uniref:Novel STAND NTPase 1 domain-containing protein n=1 Tax=Calocera viscosa (strain TUFC12733) TaxID=1330018 RepID=A0A167HPX1_CALVF|nr:hypothetical protein CALVIDRAFT_601938 [Calocera viscosa TUFC12733]